MILFYWNQLSIANKEAIELNWFISLFFIYFCDKYTFFNVVKMLIFKTI